VVREYFGVALNARFMLFTLATSFSTAALFSYITSSPILFMKVHGLSESQFGLTFSFCAFCLIVGSQLNRFLLRRFSADRLAELTGLAILVVSAALFALTVSSVAGFVVTIACIASFLFLLGMFNPNTGALALTSVHEKIGMASALMGFIQMGLSAIAAAIVSSLSGVSSTTMTTMLFACMGVSVACVFGVRLLGETAPESATSDMIHTTI
jgi:DHA1 family bicyclomycin/chloramphenicol resistance-like MFS transporter